MTAPMIMTVFDISFSLSLKMLSRVRRGRGLYPTPLGRSRLEWAQSLSRILIDKGIVGLGADVRRCLAVTGGVEVPLPG